MRRRRILGLFLPMISTLVLNLINEFFFQDTGFAIQTIFLILEIIIALCLGVIGILFFYKSHKAEDGASSPKKKVRSGWLSKALIFLVIVGFAILMSLHEYFSILDHWDIASTISLIRLIFLFVGGFLIFELMFKDHIYED